MGICLLVVPFCVPDSGSLVAVLVPALVPVLVEILRASHGTVEVALAYGSFQTLERVFLLRGAFLKRCGLRRHLVHLLSFNED
ncbi:MAG: hypothetical protein A3B11_01495 [Candidatus Taylorbacteria bacterium RIFCSPLOWO2_01_FULL_44_26]|uniref:Uncharacterized protein n=1 Tax=Candidatus Taylorbacteria bacterium RIFCSPLOWO2_01_FULL_44_26 TaxID=1802318 RepID=A0A1G2N568_9BACT|nr:MAG: hypothetical protein A3B11_01495 [Candidatus Taylorbacteria bacterium RIFCSPLOWO2_01_FULL_44_26]